MSAPITTKDTGGGRIGWRGFPEKTPPTGIAAAEHEIARLTATALAVTAERDALLAAGRRLLVQLNHAACWCDECREARAIFDSAPVSATKSRKPDDATGSTNQSKATGAQQP